MKIFILVAAVLCSAGMLGEVAAQPFVDSVMFYRVTNEERALDLVENGDLHMYYFSVAPHLLDDAENIDVHTSQAGSALSILLNPAEGETFNPFSLKEVRFAVNYLLDREGVVEVLLDGYGSPIISSFTPSDPSYAEILDTLSSFGISYSPDTARAMVHDAMKEAGANMRDGIWTMDGKEVSVTLFIREDDAIRLSIGDKLASDLEDMGFVAERMYGDLAQALLMVYGSDPADLEWHVYTEGWGTEFSKYDDDKAEFYAPYKLPGSGNPDFWTYENPKLEVATRLLEGAAYTTGAERTALIQQVVETGVGEAVRLFIASGDNTFPVNSGVEGVINSVSGGISNVFTTSNAQSGTPILLVGVKHLSQASWNPVAGYGDVYGNDIAAPISDPDAVTHPYTADTIPVRVQRSVQTSGPGGSMPVPADAIVWNPRTQGWAGVGLGTTATSVVTLDYTFSNWHHGQPMDINDILFDIYILYEWGTVTGPNDPTQDSQFVANNKAFLEDNLVAIRHLDDDTVEVYIDYWHFDEDLIGSTGVRWTHVPWEIFFAMEEIVRDGRAAFSHTASDGNNIGWLSQIDPADTALIREYLAGFVEAGTVPPAIAGQDGAYYIERYLAAIDWIDEYGHAIVSHGPFFLLSYDDAEGVVFLRAFTDDTYPYQAGIWSHFGEPAPPTIVGVLTNYIVSGKDHTVNIYTTNADSLEYLLVHDDDGIIHAGHTPTTGLAAVTIPAEVTADLQDCSLSLQVLAESDDFVIPNILETRLYFSDCADAPSTFGEILAGLDEDRRKALVTVLQHVIAEDVDGIPADHKDRVFGDPELSRMLLSLLSMVLDDGVDMSSLNELIIDP